MRIFLSLLLLLLAATATADIYKWVDAQGNVHYSDEPRSPEAERMGRLPGLSTYSPPPVPKEQPEGELSEGVGGTVSQPAAHPGYRMIKIISPEPEGTVRSSPGEVPVYVALDPVLMEGDYLKVILDGKVLPEKHTSTVMVLHNVDRGEHRVAAAVYSKEGKKLRQSAAHTFYLHRTIARKPQPR